MINGLQSLGLMGVVLGGEEVGGSRCRCRSPIYQAMRIRYLPHSQRKLIAFLVVICLYNERTPSSSSTKPSFYLLILEKSSAYLTPVHRMRMFNHVGDKCADTPFTHLCGNFSHENCPLITMCVTVPMDIAVGTALHSTVSFVDIDVYKTHCSPECNSSIPAWLANWFLFISCMDNSSYSLKITIL